MSIHICETIIRIRAGSVRHSQKFRHSPLVMPVSHLSSPSHLSPPGNCWTTFLLLCRLVCNFLSLMYMELYTPCFCQLLPVSIIILQFIHVVSCVSSSFLLMVKSLLKPATLLTAFKDSFVKSNILLF